MIPHPNNNTPPIIISWLVQEYVENKIWISAENIRNRGNKTPTTQQIYTVTLNCIQNDISIPVDRSHAEHYLWWLATCYE